MMNKRTVIIKVKEIKKMIMTHVQNTFTLNVRMI